MKAPYRNAIRSKESIKKALISLLEQKQDISEITVSEIVELADVNRGTFYNHYNNIMDVVEELENNMLDGLTSCFKATAASKDIRGFIKSLTMFFRENGEACRAIAKDLSRSVFDSLKIKFLIQMKTIQPNIDEFKMLFIINGLAGIYFNYFENRINLSLDDIEAQAIDLIEKMVK